MSDARAAPPRDAVCFTAGYTTAPFAAGVIHAYLAADRSAPAVAAGVSMGAVAAAVMRRCYEDLEDVGASAQAREAARFRFLERYVLSAAKAAEIFWGLPSTEEAAATDEGASAASRYLLRARLGELASHLPVTFGTMAKATRAYVLALELETEPERTAQAAEFSRHIGALASGVARTIARHPLWDRYEASSMRPLLGSKAWLRACALSVVPPSVFGSTLAKALLGSRVPIRDASALARFFASRLARNGDGASGGGMLAEIAQNLGVVDSLVGDYGVHRWLRRLFEDRGSEALVRSRASGVELVIAATPLDVMFRESESSTDLDGMPLEQHTYQMFARRDERLVTALRAALAAVPVFAPREVLRARWGPSVAGPDRIHMVDGHAIRDNPLPALFLYLKDPENRHIRDRLPTVPLGPPDGRTERAGVHVVYGVPIEPKDEPATLPENEMDVVGVARRALRLAKRRDTRLEVDQANFITSVVRLFPERRRHLPVLVDEIAPERELGFALPLAPSSPEIHSQAALGCRATLERLYRDEIVAITGDVPEATVPCGAVLAEIAPARAHVISHDAPGHPVLCASCPRTLRVRNPVLERSPKAIEMAQAKAGSQHVPQIVFVASGGVFRGSFQVGVLAAMRAHGVTPDLVVGASIGSIMGAACAALLKASPTEARAIVDELVSGYVDVGKRVALTPEFVQRLQRISDHAAALEFALSDIGHFLRKVAHRSPGGPVPGIPEPVVRRIEQIFALNRGRLDHAAALFGDQHVAAAVDNLLGALRTESLPNAGIQREIMGASLLQKLMNSVLGVVLRPADLRDRQPFRHDRGSWIYMTATNLVREHGGKLGLENDHHPGEVDFIASLLASGAFPAVFSPIRESAVYPGKGDDNVWLSDGGMFDNLPFIPTIQLLSTIQIGNAASLSRRDYLAARAAAPHLLIAGALEPELRERLSSVATWTLAATRTRLAELAANVKIRGTQWTAQTAHKLLAEVAATAPDDARAGVLLDPMVDAAIMAVFPATRERLNGTFAFSPSTGYERDRMLLSIAHGCFRTHEQFVDGSREKGLYLAMTALRDAGRLPTLRRLTVLREDPSCCAHFEDAVRGAIACPFITGTHSTEKVRTACATDDLHQLSEEARQ